MTAARVSVVAAIMALGFGGAFWPAMTMALAGAILILFTKPHPLRNLDGMDALVVVIPIAVFGLYWAISKSIGLPVYAKEAMMGLAMIAALTVFFHRPRARIAGDRERQAFLSFAAPDGQALVMVLRDGDVAAHTPLRASLNAAVIGSITSPGFAAAHAAPGPATVAIELLDPASMQSGPAEATLQLKEGEIAVFRAVVTMDTFRCHVALERVNSLDEARAALAPLPLMVAA